jgi:hypothetical protein
MGVIAIVGCSPAASPSAPGASPSAAASAASSPAAGSPTTGYVGTLSGTLSIAAIDAAPVEGAPLTTLQSTWQDTLAKYKAHQPNVTVVLESLPAGQTGEQWCSAHIADKSLPDITYVNECNFFAPSPQQVASGDVIATALKPHENDVSPYTGKPWREDWVNDAYRIGRCNQGADIDLWTCQTESLFQGGVWVNLDILKEYGATGMPTTYKDLWDLSAKINAAGKYQAWDSPTGSTYAFTSAMLSNLDMAPYLQPGQTGDNLTGLEVNSLFTKAVNMPDFWINQCNGKYLPTGNPGFIEALKQSKRYPEAFPGGAASFFDASRDQTGQQWLLGKAAFRLDTSGFFGNLNQAQKDGVLGATNWVAAALPKLTVDDLEDKSLKIYFGGAAYLQGGGEGDIWAPVATVRKSGVDANVDAMVLDFLQFMSAPEGQQRILDRGQIPANPDLLSQADPRLKGWLDTRDPAFLGVSQPPPVLANFWYIRQDTSNNIQSYMTGDLTLDEAVSRRDASLRNTAATNLNDTLKDLGLTELPAECRPYL